MRGLVLDFNLKKNVYWSIDARQTIVVIKFANKNGQYNYVQMDDMKNYDPSIHKF